MGKKKTRRKPSSSTPPDPEAVPVDAAAPLTPGERHLAFFNREAALSRGSAPSAIEGDDADPNAWGVPGRTIIAQGDSWFDYDILGPDLIDFLRSRHQCHVIKNFARHGDTLENMVYGTEYDGAFQRRPAQLDAVVDLVRELRPKAFLFSGGGNDIAGPEFEPFLDHSEASDRPLRQWYAEYVFGTVMPGMYERMIARVLGASPETHIFTHGYGNAIPSGVPARFALFTFGPWLRPGLVGKGWTDLVQGREVVRDLIGRFNDMLAGLATRHAQFHYVDLRPEIQDADWENELHLSPDGFRRCAAKIYGVIEASATGWPR